MATKISPKFLVGTSGWSYPRWRGTFYPDALPQSKWFAYYAKYFPTVEINATYYRNFSSDVYANWFAQAPNNFKYALKAHRLIVHRKQIDLDTIQNFWSNAQILGTKLGLILLQLPPHARYDIEWLEQLLLAFPAQKKLAVEFRNENWLTLDVKKLLQNKQVAFCCSDAPRIDFTPWMTGTSGYIRLHGYDRGDWYSKKYSKIELKNIAAIAHRMVHAGAKQVYIFFNNDYMGYAPKNALQLLDIL